MAIRYKFDVLEALKRAGYTSYKLRQDGILSESVMSNLRAKKAISFDAINKICKILNCQPGDIIEYVKD